MNFNLHLAFFIVINCINLIYGYLNVNLADELCSPKNVSSMGLTLLDTNESAAIITQKWNMNSNTFNDCEFMLFSNENSYRIPRGTYIVITHLRFRRDPKTDKCLDYIQFQNSFMPTNDTFCGDTSKEGTHAGMTLDYSDRETTIKIHIDSTIPLTEPLELRMVVTAHSQCNHKSDLKCNPSEPYSCISRHFVGDNITNCLAPCRDESECFMETKVPKLTNLKADEQVSEKNKDQIQNRLNDNSQMNNNNDDAKCITVNSLEDQLKQNNFLLLEYITQRDNRIIQKLKEETESYFADNAKSVANCASKDFVEFQLKKNLHDTLEAIGSLFTVYRIDFQNLINRIENLEKSLPNKMKYY